MDMSSCNRGLSMKLKMHFLSGVFAPIVLFSASALAMPIPLVFDNTGFALVNANTTFNGGTTEDISFTFHVASVTDFSGQISGTTSDFGFGSLAQEVELFKVDGVSFLFDDLGENFFTLSVANLAVGDYGFRVRQTTSTQGGSFSGFASCSAGAGACASSAPASVPEPTSVMLVGAALLALSQYKLKTSKGGK